MLVITLQHAHDRHVRLGATQHEAGSTIDRVSSQQPSHSAPQIDRSQQNTSTA
jgi:hypothetical protein